jgi:diguanylate cyclase (GGDEF)-like protein
LSIGHGSDAFTLSMSHEPTSHDSSSIRLDRLDLAPAVRLLRHAGRPDPMLVGGDETARLQALLDALCDLSLRDGLTGLVNATFFHASLARELDRSARTGRPCALLMIDLDHFKAVNDTYGHPAGDLVLRALAGRLQAALRNMDIAARAGGEEFAVILPECTPVEAVCAGTRLHQAINPVVLPVGDAMLVVTASAGLSWTDCHTGTDPAVLVAQADRELYRAKNLGRNQLCHPPLDSSHVTRAERAALLPGRAEKEPQAPETRAPA